MREKHRKHTHLYSHNKKPNCGYLDTIYISLLFFGRDDLSLAVTSNETRCLPLLLHFGTAALLMSTSLQYPATGVQLVTKKSYKTHNCIYNFLSVLVNLLMQ